MSNAADRTFAEKFQRLIDAMAPADLGRSYNDAEIAAMCSDPSRRVSRQYINQLRHGQRGEPRSGFVQRICRVFGVPEDYFSSAETEHAVLQQIDAVKKGAPVPETGEDPRDAAEAQYLAQRIMRLTPDQRQVISGLLTQLDQQSRRKGG